MREEESRLEKIQTYILHHQLQTLIMRTRAAQESANPSDLRNLPAGLHQICPQLHHIQRNHKMLGVNIESGLRL